MLINNIKLNEPDVEKAKKIDKKLWRVKLFWTIVALCLSLAFSFFGLPDILHKLGQNTESFSYSFRRNPALLLILIPITILGILYSFIGICKQRDILATEKQIICGQYTKNRIGFFSFLYFQIYRYIYLKFEFEQYIFKLYLPSLKDSQTGERIKNGDIVKLEIYKERVIDCQKINLEETPHGQA